jgi:hypothetical protein
VRESILQHQGVIFALSINFSTMKKILRLTLIMLTIGALMGSCKAKKKTIRPGKPIPCPKIDC